ncbi:MAG: glycosyltransferase family 2 protein [Oscillospiraceae bacterium]|nr:glycosyltransferase family 2 protein [Oscillospiraceae bacterium]
MQEPLISVVMPVYNAADTLARALSSLEKQSIGFEKLEVLIAEDCSPDGSRELCEAYAEGRENVKLILMEKNSGFAGAPRNAALEKASAPYIMFLDADDEYEKDACLMLYEAAEKHGADIVSGYFSERHTGDGSLDREISSDYASMREGVCEFSESMSGWRPVSDALWCKIYKRDIIEKNSLRFQTDIPGEDVIFLAAYLCRCRKGVYIKKKILNYTVKDLSVSHGPSARFFLLTPLQLQRLRELLEKEGRGEFFREFMEDFAAVDYYLGRLIAECAAFDDETLLNILKAWRSAAEYALREKLTLHGPLVRLLVEKLVSDFEGALFACCCLCETVSLREREKKDILDSRSWKLASKIARVFQ